MLDRKQVQINGKTVWMAKHRLRPGDELRYPSPKAAKQDNPKRVPVHIYYQDADLVVVEKPAGIIAENHASSLEERLRKELGLPKLRALHRLDRGTSGLLLFVKRPDHREAFVDLFRSQEIEKIYLAVVRGQLPHKEFRVDVPLDNIMASTIFRVIESQHPYHQVECRILTGRTHQIRRHLVHSKAQVVGDRQYQLPDIPPPRELEEPWLLLHASQLLFTHPLSGEPLSFESPLPLRMEQFLKKR